MSEERNPLGGEAMAVMAEEIAYRARMFAAHPAESFTRDAELQRMTAHASRLLWEVERQRGRIRALEGALGFYASQDSWTGKDRWVGGEIGWREYYSEIDEDRGAKARAVLYGEAPEEKGTSS